MLNVHARSALAVLVVALSFNCSGSGSGGTGGGSATGGGSTGGGSTGGGSASTGGGAGTNAEARGGITVRQSCYSGLGCSGSASAYFVIDDGGYNGGSHCATSMVGGCSVIDCTFDGGAAPSSPPAQSAGDITIAGSWAGDIALSYVGVGYAQVPVSDSLWDGGETLTVSAVGASVPAFSGKTVVAPHELTLTAPSCAVTGCGSISQAAPLTVTFTGGEASAITAGVQSYRADRTITANCSGTASPITFPTAVLSLLGKSDAGYTCSFVIAPANTTTFSAGPYNLTFTATGTLGGGPIELGD